MVIFERLTVGGIMAGYEQTFLEQITNIDGIAKSSRCD